MLTCYLLPDLTYTCVFNGVAIPELDHATKGLIFAYIRQHCPTIIPSFR